MNEEIRTLDLFAGIGSFSYSLERLCPAGAFRTVAFCEQDSFAQRVLRKHWPDTPIYDDVRTIPTDGLGRIELICSGFPCQPWSVAGQQRGAEDDRDLWPEMVRLVEELRPQWLIGENVRGFVNEPMGLQRSLSDLESIGYQAVTFVIPACAVDAPHRRDRVWIVANAAQLQRNGSREYSEQSKRQVSEFRKRCGKIFMADTKRIRQGQATEPVNGGFANIWLPEPDVGRVAHGVPNRVDRLKCLGNAVVPQVVEKIGRAILKGHR